MIIFGATVVFGYSCFHKLSIGPFFFFFCGLKYNSGGSVCSSEAKPVLEDKLSEFAASLIAAYDNGEILSALEEGHAGWQKWVKSFGKLLKRKVSESSILSVFFFLA